MQHCRGPESVGVCLALDWDQGLVLSAAVVARIERGSGPRLARWLLGARRRASGVRLHRLRAGRFELPALVGGPGGTPLIMLHGFSDTKDSFVDVARVIAPTRRVILPDLPGFSEASAPVDHRYTVASMGAVLVEALRELAPEAVHLAGNSLGGAIAAWIAIEHPRWVRSLTLIGAAGVPMPVPSAMQRHIEAGHNPFVVREEDEFEPFVRFVVERKPFMPGVVLRAMARDFVARRSMNEKILDELVDDAIDLRERLREIAVPTMVLWGDRDRLIDLSAGKVFHRSIPRARLVVMHGIGHCPQVEAPGATARRILETVAAGEHA